MGAQRSKFASRSSGRPSLEVIEGEGLPEAFNDAIAFVNGEGGEYFWGIEKEREGVFVPQYLGQRLQLLRDTVLLIPKESEELDWRTRDWAEGNITLTKNQLQHLLDRQSPSLPSGLLTKNPRAPLTNREAYEHKKVLPQALKELGSRPHPVAVIHNLYDLRKPRDTITERDELLGSQALIHFFFEAGGDEILAALKRANIEVHST